MGHSRRSRGRRGVLMLGRSCAWRDTSAMFFAARGEACLYFVFLIPSRLGTVGKGVFEQRRRITDHSDYSSLISLMALQQGMGRALSMTWLFATHSASM